MSSSLPPLLEWPSLWGLWKGENMRVGHMYAGVASQRIEFYGCLALFQSESVRMYFLNSFLLGRGSMGWLWESSAYSYYTQKEEDHERRVSLEWNFKFLCSTEKGRSFTQNFLFFILESFGVCSVQHPWCNKLDWGPPGPQRWTQCCSQSLVMLNYILQGLVTLSKWTK